MKKNKKHVDKKNVEKLVETTELNGEILEEIKNKSQQKKEQVPIKDEENRESNDAKRRFDKASQEDVLVRRVKVPPKKNPFLIPLLILTLLMGFAYLGTTFFFSASNHYTVDVLVSRLIILVFTILFVLLGIQIRRRKKCVLFSCITILLLYFSIGIYTTVTGSSWNLPMTDLRGKTLTEALSWAKENQITIEQEYEYSDMVEEYHIISQDIPTGKNLKNVKNITVAVSEGASPYKEIIIPSMIGWDSDRVIHYVAENYLSHVTVEFVASSKEQDTVIEQSKMGSVKRDEEIKLTFSHGEEWDGDEVKLIDLTNKSRFEAVFYLKQHGLKYDTKEEFSDTIKKGYVKSQNKEPGTVVSREHDHIELIVSKGAEIKVPDLTKMDLTELTEWIIKNKLKLTLLNQYDESVKEGHVIRTNQEEGATLSEGSVVEITISKGPLKMPSFDNLDAFKKWADEYNISYQEEHEFSSDFEAGKVIKYSYKTGDVIKNSDTIIVTISDGKEIKVPNLIGMSKQEAINALKKAGLGYNFIYRDNGSTSKDKVIAQSIEKGSSVSSGTTVTFTLSSGKSGNSTSTGTSTNTSSNTNKNESSNSGSQSSSSSSTPPKEEEKPSCDANKKQIIYIQDAFIEYEPTATCANIKKAYPNHKFSCSYQKDSGLRSGFLINVSEIDEHEFNFCDTIYLKIAQD